VIDFEPIDRHFAALMQRLGADADVALAALLVSRAARQGDICLDLAAWAGTPLPEQNCATPSLDAWRKAVQSSPVVGSDNDYTPMVLDAKSRLYLRRYYDYEQCLAAAIRNLSARRQSVDWDKARRTLSALFPTESETIDYQALAAIAALATGFTVVTGGPGTGKTTTVAKILALILDQDHQARIALAAPTGKAADRLQASVRQAAARLACGDAVKAAMPAEAFTIHRLLGPLPDSPYFRHHALNPLPYDVVVVDEASMVDLALMAKLVDAVPQGARLILLGDRDQLASVQAGYVLGDLCDTGVEHAYSAAFAALVRDVAGYDIQGGGPAGFVDSIIELRTNYRFAPDSGIGRLSRQVNTGECSMIEAHDLPDLGFTPLPAAPLLKRHLKELIIQGYAPYLTATDPAERLERLNGFRVLCALKEGPYGVGALNALAEDVLESSGLIKPMGRQYHGRPVLITQRQPPAPLQRRCGHYPEDRRWIEGLLPRPGRQTAYVLARPPARTRHGLCHDRAQEPGVRVRPCAHGPARARHPRADARARLHRHHPGADPPGPLGRAECPEDRRNAADKTDLGPKGCAVGLMKTPRDKA